MAGRWWIVLWLTGAVSVSYADGYRLFFGAFDATRPAVAEQHAKAVEERLHKADIEAVRERTADGKLLVVKSRMFSSYDRLKEVKERASHADVDYFVKRYREGAQKRAGVDRKTSRMPCSKQKVRARFPHNPTSEERAFFGENKALVALIEEGVRSREKLQKDHKAYLKSVKEAYREKGLEVRLGAERAINRGQNGFDTGFAWNMLDGGYLGNRKAVEEIAARKSMAYARDIDQISANYEQAAQYELESVGNTIHGYYTKRRVDVWKRLRAYSAKALREGSISSVVHADIKEAYRRERASSTYLSKLRQRPFDRRHYTLLHAIEKVRLLPLKRLTEKALAEAPSLQILRERLKLHQVEDGWTDRLKAELYVDRKSYTFIDRRETLAGLKVRIPLKSVEAKRHLQKMEADRIALKLESAQRLLGEEIARYYHEISSLQNSLKQLRHAVAAKKGSIAFYDRVYRESVDSQGSDAYIKKMKSRVRLLDLKEKVWVTRIQILRDLITLQYLSGVKIV